MQFENSALNVEILPSSYSFHTLISLTICNYYFNDCIYLLINCSFLFHSRFLLILYIYIHFVNIRPLANQLAEWATVLKHLKLYYIILYYIILYYIILYYIILYYIILYCYYSAHLATICYGSLVGRYSTLHILMSVGRKRLFSMLQECCPLLELY